MHNSVYLAGMPIEGQGKSAAELSYRQQVSTSLKERQSMDDAESKRETPLAVQSGASSVIITCKRVPNLDLEAEQQKHSEE